MTCDHHVVNLANAALQVLGGLLQQTSREFYDVVITAIEKSGGDQERARAIVIDGLRASARELVDESKPITEVEIAGTTLIVLAALTLIRSEIKMVDLRQGPSRN